MPLCALHSLATQPPVLNFRRDAAWALERTRISSLLLKEGREEKRRENKKSLSLLASKCPEFYIGRYRRDEYNSFQMTWQSNPSQQTALPHRHSSAAGNAASGYLSLEPRQQKSRASSNLGPS
uniref:Uncharacterized protein n=1 Tax=Photinus pyralis TaxID=7054 RepID=A0A1Y1N7M8_PHOPY